MPTTSGRSPAGPARAPYLRAGFLALVLVGGTVGTAARAWVGQAFPPVDGGWPWGTFAVNLAGSFLLGLLLSALRASSWDAGRRARASVALGTGVLGGLTTYSTFAVEIVLLARGGAAATGLGYGLLSVLAGFGAAVVGYRSVRR